MFSQFKPLISQGQRRVNPSTLREMSLIEDAELEVLLRLPFADLQNVLFVNKAVMNTLKRVFAGFTSRMLVEYYLDFPEVAGSFIKFLEREKIERPANDDVPWKTVLHMVHTKKLPDQDFQTTMQHLVKCIVMTPTLACRLIQYIREYGVEVRNRYPMEGLALAWFDLFYFLVSDIPQLSSPTRLSDALAEVTPALETTDNTEAGIAFARALRNSVRTSLQILHHTGPVPVDLTQFLSTERAYYLNLSEIDLSRRVLDNLNLSGIRFYNARMAEVTLNHCDASYSDFSYSGMRVSTIFKTKFFRSLFRKVDLNNCTVKDCTFEETDMRGLSEHALSIWGFRGLEGVKFIRPKLDNVLLWHFAIIDKKIRMHPAPCTPVDIDFMQKFTILFLLIYQIERLEKSKNPDQKAEQKKLMKLADMISANPAQSLLVVYKQWIMSLAADSVLVQRGSSALFAPRLDLTPLTDLIPMMQQFLTRTSSK
jgi:uncharacterized protein YjbI with pentapeptide repeats